MPQLSLETYVTQYFWLILILLSFYYIVITKVLPNIAKVFKTRAKLESKSEDLLAQSQLEDIKLPIKVYNVTTEINNQKGLEIEKAKLNWIKKNVRNTRNTT